MSEPLRPCRHCGGTISRYAAVCPHCGGPRVTPEEREAALIRGKLFDLGLAIAAALGLYVFLQHGGLQWLQRVLEPLFRSMFRMP